MTAIQRQYKKRAIMRKVIGVLWLVAAMLVLSIAIVAERICQCTPWYTLVLEGLLVAGMVLRGLYVGLYREV